jgi:hypothetical protein
MDGPVIDIGGILVVLSLLAMLFVAVFGLVVKIWRREL